MRWKTQCRNQQHALDYSAIGDEFITKQNAKLLAVYDQQIEALEKAIQDLIEGDTVLKAQVERLTAIKGLALLSVTVLIAETNGFENFVNQRQLVSHAGYDVVENQSGNRSGKTRISKKGNAGPPVRSHSSYSGEWPTFNAVRFGEPTCQALYERVYQRTNTKMKAYVAVQKKLLLLAYALWHHQTTYVPAHADQAAKENLLTSKLDQTSKKIAPTSGTTQDQSTVAVLSFG